MTLHKISSVLKAHARHSLLGCLGTAVGSTFLYFLLVFLLSELAAGVFPGKGAGSFAATQVLLWMVSTLLGLFEYGRCCIYMNLSYEQTAHVGQLFAGFLENTDKILTIQAILAAVSSITTLPANIVLNFYPENLETRLLAGALFAIGGIVSILVDLIYALSYYLLLDYPSLTALQAMKKSRTLMRGSKRVLLYLYLSFLPLYLLSVLSLGIGALWVYSYQCAALAAFYRGRITSRNQ